ncbi:MAG: hypothetical protein WAX89_01465 [Alphaproteobacteria bacterium]
MGMDVQEFLKSGLQHLRAQPRLLEQVKQEISGEQPTPVPEQFNLSLRTLSAKGLTDIVGAAKALLRAKQASGWRSVSDGVLAWAIGFASRKSAGKLGSVVSGTVGIGVGAAVAKVSGPAAVPVGLAANVAATELWRKVTAPVTQRVHTLLQGFDVRRKVHDKARGEFQAELAKLVVRGDALLAVLKANPVLAKMFENVQEMNLHIMALNRRDAGHGGPQEGERMRPMVSLPLNVIELDKEGAPANMAVLPSVIATVMFQEYSKVQEMLGDRYLLPDVQRAKSEADACLPELVKLMGGFGRGEEDPIPAELWQPPVIPVAPAAPFGQRRPVVDLEAAITAAMAEEKKKRDPQPADREGLA